MSGGYGFLCRRMLVPEGVPGPGVFLYTMKGLRGLEYGYTMIYIGAGLREVVMP